MKSSYKVLFPRLKVTSNDTPWTEFLSFDCIENFYLKQKQDHLNSTLYRESLHY